MLKPIRTIFKKSQLYLILAISLILGLLSSLMVQPVQAEIVRSAQIEKVTGIVHIQKAGSVNPIRAYEGMILYHGDHIQTEANSSVVFQVTGRGDNITVEEKSRLYISDLRNESGKVKTSFFLWSGSVWVQASTLTNSEDEFEIETPAAYMSVRGTTLFVGVDPLTGESKFFIASGVGRVNKRGEGESGPGTTLYPNQGIFLDEDTDANDYEGYTNIADLNALISNTSEAIIQAILASKAAMDQENAEYIDMLLAQQGTAGEISQEAIDRINQNLDNLVGNIINNAIDQGKVDEAVIKAFIAQINEQLDKKLDLNNVKPQELSAQEKAKQAQIKILEKERKKKQEAEKQKQEELKKQNEQLQQKLKEQLEKQKEEKQKAAEAAKQKAAEEYAKKLADDAARSAFEAKQKALAAEKARQDAAVKSAPKAPVFTAPPSQPRPDPGEVDTPPVLKIISPTTEISNNTGSLDIVIQTQQNTTVTVSTYGSDDILATGVGRGLGSDVTLNVTGLDEGDHIFTVKATDAAGHTTIITIPAIHIDKTPPIIEEFWVDGESPMTRPAEVHVMAEEGALIQILHDNVPIASGIGDGENEIIITLPLLDIGDYWFTIKATDAAGNVTTQNFEDSLHVYFSEG